MLCLQIYYGGCELLYLRWVQFKSGFLLSFLFFFFLFFSFLVNCVCVCVVVVVVFVQTYSSDSVIRLYLLLFFSLGLYVSFFFFSVMFGLFGDWITHSFMPFNGV